MARQRKEKKAKDIKLRQPDRSGPTEKTLLQLAEERELFKQADVKQRQNRHHQQEIQKPGGDAQHGQGDDEDEEGLSPTAERIMETLLYSVSLAMLHFTLDVLVQRQYGETVEWYNIVERATQAFMVFAALVYALHPHSAVTTVVPGLPLGYQPAARQTIFLAISLVAGCYLIYITNEYSYLAVLKQAPPVGALWVWSVIELNLGLAVLTLAGSGLFFWQGGYTIR
ncbi:hypothetical protein VP1G_10164 [Cytospora mali]|uniref:DUF7719 domain-containing protein n=1 Tax=Cytospora mali TaxID=578113 RepID=A0A194VG85_CYTMA|nr:hypothetical protein VP1G_10164 [Valsa mali var. pyri (nom. inval.)]